MKNMSLHIDSRSADLLRSTALFLVVLLHVSATYFHDFHASWSVSVFYGSVSRICIPLFFMLSGALLLEKQEPVGRFFRKRAAKVIVPTLFWSLAYLLYRKYGMGQRDASLDPTTMLHGPTYYHLWFMYAIMMLYMATPVLRLFHRHASLGLKLGALAFWFVACSALPVLGVYSLAPTGFDLRFIPIYGGFMLLGALLARHEERWALATSALLFALGTALTFIMTIWYSHWIDTPDQKFYDYLAPNVILAAVGAYLLIARSGSRMPPRPQRAIQLLSRYTFGVYFLHVIVLNALQGFLFHEYYGLMLRGVDALFAIPAQALGTVLVSLLIVAGMRRIPVMRHVV